MDVALKKCTYSVCVEEGKKNKVLYTECLTITLSSFLFNEFPKFNKVTVMIFE